MTKWKKPQALKADRFADIVKLVHVTETATHFLTFDTIMSGKQYRMNMREFARIVNAGKFVDGKIIGTFFLNPSGLLRLYD